MKILAFGVLLLAVFLVIQAEKSKEETTGFDLQKESYKQMYDAPLEEFRLFNRDPDSLAPELYGKKCLKFKCIIKFWKIKVCFCVKYEKHS